MKKLITTFVICQFIILCTFTSFAQEASGYNIILTAADGTDTQTVDYDGIAKFQIIKTTRFSSPTSEKAESPGPLNSQELKECLVNIQLIKEVVTKESKTETFKCTQNVKGINFPNNKTLIYFSYYVRIPEPSRIGVTSNQAGDYTEVIVRPKPEIQPTPAPKPSQPIKNKESIFEKFFRKIKHLNFNYIQKIVMDFYEKLVLAYN
jgi:hypothetical protein